MNFRCYFMIFVVFGLVGGSLQAQQQRNWVEMMEDPTVNFYEVQQAFEDYWRGKEVTRGSGWKPFKRWEHFWEPRVHPHGQFPDPDQSYRAYQSYLNRFAPQMLQPNNADWQSLGPDDWNPIGWNPGIGRINCMARHPVASNIIYAGAPAGGFWRTYDGGATWETTTDNEVVLGVSSIVIHPTNFDIIYIATGDGDAGDTRSIGVLKSSDGGDTWQQTGLNWQVIQARRISKMLIHPTQPDILFAATSIGIYRTTDAGANWSVVQVGNFKDLEFKPGDPSVIYGSGVEVYRSINGGTSFSRQNSGLPAPSTVSRLAIAVTEADPEYLYVLAGNNTDFGLRGLYRSTNSGTNFQTRSTEPNILGYGVSGESSGGQSWYDLAIAVSHLNAEEVFVGGINVWRSTDGGAQWQINGYWYYPNASIPYVHADIHSLDFFGGELYAGTDGGLFHTTDAGSNWLDLSPGMVTTQFYRFGGYPGDRNLIIGGTQDNGTNRLSNGTWDHVYGADGMEALIDYSDPNIMYACIQNGGLVRSTDGGNNFSDIRGNGISGNGAWVTPYVIHPTNPQILFAGYGNVWKTENRGDSWTAISSLSITVNSLAVAKSNPNYIYVASRSQLYRTSDGGGSWVLASNGLPVATTGITYIAVSDDNPQKLWVSLSGYSNGNKVYQSNDGGDNWFNVSGTLPNLPANCITYEGEGINALYLGTDVGVFYRNDFTGDWEPFSSGLPNVIVQELEIHRASGTIKAATYGRGIWESPLETRPASFQHQPLSDTEDITGPYDVVANITPGSIGVNADSVMLFYGSGGQVNFVTSMTPTGNQNEYLGQITGQGSEVEINYYMMAVDSNALTSFSPVGAPAVTHSFFAGADIIAPELQYEPFERLNIAELPWTVAASASDNIAIGSVSVEYSLNGNSQPSFELTRSGIQDYSGDFPLDANSVSIGDIIEYQVVAEDAAAVPNQTIAGPFSFTAEQVLQYQFSANVAIPNNDPAGVSDTVIIGGDLPFGIIDLDVGFKAAHANFGDFIVTLTSPQGTVITLMDRPGHPALPLGSPGEDPDIILDDQAATSVEDAIINNGTIVTGSFQPDPGVLADFNMEGYLGQWIINVRDASQPFAGNFLEWGLTISVDGIVGIDEDNTIPRAFDLLQNYPNPFNPQTDIRYQIADIGFINLVVFDVLGRKVRTLVKKSQVAGSYQVTWDGRNDAGVAVSSGIYFYRLQTGEFSRTRRMLLMK